MINDKVLPKSDSDEDLSKWVKSINKILIFVVILLALVPTFLTWYAAQRYPRVSTLQISEMQLLDSYYLCPGDKLIYEYRIKSKGEGNLDRRRTLWRIEPPRTVLFSETEEYIMDGDREDVMTEAWRIPETYINPSTDDVEPLPPGLYKRIISIASPTNSTLSTVSSVIFEIPENCP